MGNQAVKTVIGRLLFFEMMGRQLFNGLMKVKIFGLFILIHSIICNFFLQVKLKEFSISSAS